MRINTSGKKEYRNDLYERTADVLEESTKTGAIDSACIHAKQDIEAKQEAIEFLAERLPPAQLDEAVDILSTDVVSMTAETETNISVDDS